MTLRQLIDGLAGARLIGEADVEVRAVSDDSRAIEPGDVFVAVKGMRSDGHAFIPTAVERGAIALVVEREAEAQKARILLAQQKPGAKMPAIVVVASTPHALGVLVARSFGDPAKALTLIGVTGTNGKTTTTYLVEAILRAAGKTVGVIGTVEMRFGATKIPASYTTPTPQILQSALAQMRDGGCTHVVMEVTSSAIVMDRIVGLEFAVAAFSNLTQDHLDVHGTMAAYRDAKRRLFTDYLTPNGTAVVNVDDPEGEGMAAGCLHVLAVSTDPGSSAELRVIAADSSVRGIRMKLVTLRGQLDIESKPLIGAYNVQNLALAVGIAEALEVPHEAIVRGIADTAPPGRVERVVNDAELDIFVDYAHTPDALRNVLAALRPITTRRLICVFGCGGDRDPTKRPKMGAAVAELADVAIVTSDNPRTEDPRAIIDMILPAVPKPFFVDPDRRTAIRAAIAEATPGDVIVIAGKGHEDYQVVGTTKHHFDDREEAAAAVAVRERQQLAALAADCDGELVAGEASREGVEEGERGAARASGPRRQRGTGDAGAMAIDRIVIDSRIALPGSLYIAIRGETHDGHRFVLDAIRAGAHGVMVDREGRQWIRFPQGVSAPAIVVDDTRLAIGRIARAHRRGWSSPGGAKKLVAITGSAGKTTTKELTRAALAMAGTTHAAEGSLNNETGVPLTLLALRQFHAYAVVEMGMRGLGQIEYLTRIAEPDVAVVVNAGTAHIELLGSTDAIAKAKSEIWLGLRANGTVVRPIDDARLETWAREHQPRARHVTFGQREGADVRLVEYRPTDAGGVVKLEAFGDKRELVLQLVGEHAAIDACAALAAAHAAGASIDQALAGLARARPAAMRGEIVEVGGRKVIVDCYNANPASMAAALRTLAERGHGGPAIAVVGDMLELGTHAPAAHREVGVLAKQLGLHVIALGEHAPTVVAASGGELATDPADAADRALSRTESGGWILLKASRGMKLERVLDAMKEQTL